MTTIKTNKLNVRPAFKNELEEFEYTIRQEWQEEYGYEVSFQWYAKGQDYLKYSKRGKWTVLLDGEAVGTVLRETNSGEFFGEWVGWIDQAETEEAAIGEIEMHCGYYTDDDEPDWDYSPNNPRNVDPKRLEIILNSRAKVAAVARWLQNNNGILIAKDYKPETAFRLKGKNPPCMSITKKLAAQAIAMFYTPAQGGQLSCYDGAAFTSFFTLEHGLEADVILEEISTVTKVEYHTTIYGLIPSTRQQIDAAKKAARRYRKLASAPDTYRWNRAVFNGRAEQWERRVRWLEQQEKQA